MRTIVVKFGGTSVATAEGRELAIAHIHRELATGSRVVAVVSAMGRKGAPYATDTLIGLLPENPNPMIKDLLMSCGETVSACVFADALSRTGVAAVPMTGRQAGVRTNGIFGSADVVGMDAEKIKSVLREGAVPVVTGFQGTDEEGFVNTLGRGGSDTSAVEIGGYIGADCVDIYTDVAGIAVTDPRIVPEARYLTKVGFSDMLALSQFGAKVVHPRAVAAAKAHAVRVSVRSTFRQESGTVLCPDSERENGLVGIALIKECAICETPVADAIKIGAGREARYILPGQGGEEALVTVLYRGEDKHARLKKAADGLGTALIKGNGDLVHVLVQKDVSTEAVRTLYRDMI